MPLILPDKLPAIDILKEENIHVLAAEQACTLRQGSPLRIAILNLMPIKVTTEVDLVRVLSGSPLLLEIHWMKLGTHVCKNTSAEHMNAFYREFSEMRREKFDGLIITGAPVEHLDYPEVNYWEEISEIFSWARANVTSTLYICWAAQAGLFYHYGVPKHPLSEKMFGIFPQTPLDRSQPIFRGFDDVFNMPHSRHTEIRREDVLRVPELTLIAESPLSGVSIVMARGGKEIFVTGHSEYSPNTLDQEYKRDLGKGLPIQKPYNYYLNDDPAQPPLVTWRSHGSLLYQNWLHYYVRPGSTSNISDIP